MSIRPKIEAALSATAERLSAGSGHDPVRHAKNDIATIEASSGNLAGRYADEEVRLAAPLVVETKHPEGDPVTFTKAHDGIVVVFASSFVFVRGMGFGAREIEVVECRDATVERVTAVVEGTRQPAVRVTGPAGKPTFVAVVASEKASPAPEAQAAVLDELVGLLSA
jgi:hypothetical protein